MSAFADQEAPLAPLARQIQVDLISAAVTVVTVADCYEGAIMAAKMVVVVAGDVIEYVREDAGGKITWGTGNAVRGWHLVPDEKLTVGTHIPVAIAIRLVEDGLCAVVTPAPAASTVAEPPITAADLAAEAAQLEADTKRFSAHTAAAPVTVASATGVASAAAGTSGVEARASETAASTATGLTAPSGT